jgi:hypothetical protein
MRKVFWCCAVVAILAAAGFYWAADYTCRYPDALFSRCAVAACEMTAEANPISRVGYGIVYQAHATMKTVVASIQPSQPSKAPCCSAPPKDLVKAQPAPEACPAPPTGAWDAEAMAEGQMLGRITIPGEAEIRRALNPMHDAPLGGAEESEFVPPIMPRVVDRVEGPGVMEPVKDYEEEQTIEVLEGFPLPGGFEESEIEPVQMPVIDDYHHYRCPQSGSCCPHSGKCATYPTCPSGSCPKVPSPGTGEEVSEPKEKPETLKKKDRSMATPPGCSCPKTDTMEFRRSDGTPGQFEKIPY